MDIIPQPGLLCVSDENVQPDRLRSFVAHGYKWIAYQAQNGGKTRDYDLGPARAAGLSPGVWGVSYDVARFRQDAFALGVMANHIGAEHVTMDIEFAAKGTRAARALRPVIDGLRAANWRGPINLNTMGPPHGATFNDYEIDILSFLETGGGVVTQAHFNETDSFRPSLAVTYWKRFMDLKRLNLQISIYPSEGDKEKPHFELAGAEWLPLLEEAGLGKAFSIFMAEGVTETDLRGLDKLTLPPPPAPTVDVADHRADALRLLAETVNHWRDNTALTEAQIQLQRQSLAWRVLNVVQSGANLKGLRDFLDRAGAPQP